MSIESQIQELLDELAPLRALPEDEAEAAGLPQLIERVNALRAVQALAKQGIGETIDAIHDAEVVAIADSVSPRRGRPPKAKTE